MRGLRRFLGGLVLLGVVWVGFPPAFSPAHGGHSTTPVVLVHGLLGSGQDMGTMQEALRREGFGPVEAVSLAPSDGTVSITALASQLDRFVEELRARAGRPRVDVVGYSMGALVARYWLQRMDGKLRARRYVSIAGPHHGVPGGFLSDRVAAHEMRPNSPFLRDLDRDRDPWGEVEVHDFFSPLDVVIIPAITAVLPRARATRAFPVATHHHMILDPRVLAAVAAALGD